MKVKTETDYFTILVIIMVVIGLLIIGNISAFRFLYVPGACGGVFTFTCLKEGALDLCTGYLTSALGLSLVGATLALFIAFLLVYRKETANTRKKKQAVLDLQSTLKNADL